jgi:thiol-disulfide isomerase/thioredoxin
MKKLSVALCVAVLLASCTGASKSDKPLVAMQDAPEFALQNIDGSGELKSADFKGKVVVLNFWATWCQPCKVEMPHFSEIGKRLKGKGVEFIAVTYESGTPKSIQPYVKELKIDFPVVMGTDELDAGLGGHMGLPTTFLIGKDWKVYRKFFGVVRDYKKFEDDLNALVEKAAD